MSSAKRTKGVGCGHTSTWESGRQDFADGSPVTRPPAVRLDAGDVEGVEPRRLLGSELACLGFELSHDAAPAAQQDEIGEAGAVRLDGSAPTVARHRRPEVRHPP
jgi:hypothetical protein